MVVANNTGKIFSSFRLLDSSGNRSSLEPFVSCYHLYTLFMQKLININIIYKSSDARFCKDCIRLLAVSSFRLEFIEPQKDIANSCARPRLGFRAPSFAMSFRGSTNSRGKIGTARSLRLHRDGTFDTVYTEGD